MSSSTWQFLSGVKASNPFAKLIYHYHIPKTGGTSIFSNLLESSTWIAFNADQDSDILANKMRLFLGDDSGQPALRLLGRSHNNAKTLAGFRANLVYDYSFTFYRDPLSIQLSNMNMIVERVAGLQGGRIDGSSEVGRWASTWVNLLNLSDNAKPLEVAEKLATSEEYLKRYAAILSRYFPVDGADLAEWLKAQKMVILDMGILDDFQASVFGVESPAKSNQSKQQTLHAGMLSESFRQRLLGNDVNIGESLHRFIVAKIDDPRLQELVSYAKG